MTNTLFVTDDRMLKHRCEWDSHHIERPQRLNQILCKLKVIALQQKDELLMVHDEEYVQKMKNTSALTMEELEDFSSGFEDIYVNESTYEAATLSAGCALELTSEVWKSGKGANGFAAIRPPGHHSSQDQACGFCIFNNVVLCAKQAIADGASRVLIIDWDIHAGQGTQYAIADDPRIRLISIHRYENGKFWPQLEESATKNKYENTLNVTLNELGYGDFDYAAIYNSIILPVIAEWNPDIILVSCGFDAAIGDCEGQMTVSPYGFAWMTGLVANQEIPLVLLLEGGYFVEGIGENALTVLRSLKSPHLHSSDHRVSEHLLKSIARALFVMEKNWNIRLIDTINSIRDAKNLLKLTEDMTSEYDSVREFSLPYPTRNVYPPQLESVNKYFEKQLYELMEERKQNKGQELQIVLNKQTTTIEFTINERNYVLHLQSQFELVFCFNFILLPLSLKFQLKTNVDTFKLSDYQDHFETLKHGDCSLSEKLIEEISLMPQIDGLF
ncbi:Hist-deacetyl domain-containing protein [Aphelenchoides besseyi]|nr:Hist-deacetyl domain-containing protein [Aphelenchoides besseyi]